MVRRLILGIALGTALLVAGPADAQDSPGTTTTSTSSTTSSSTTSSTATTLVVLPTTIDRVTTTLGTVPTTVKVAGVTVDRPLPRTGNDFGPQVIVGSGLTAVGLALAITARVRRQRLQSPA